MKLSGSAASTPGPCSLYPLDSELVLKTFDRCSNRRVAHKVISQAYGSQIDRYPTARVVVPKEILSAEQTEGIDQPNRIAAYVSVRIWTALQTDRI